MPINTEEIRRDFPIFDRHHPHGNELVYLDNAASTQKPHEVIEAEAKFYRENYANIHRGIYQLSVEATYAYENARKKVAEFINAKDHREIIFTKGTTEAVNLVATSFLSHKLKHGDEVLISHMEHHSNLLPWQVLCKNCNGNLKVIPMNEKGELRMEELEDFLGTKTRLLALVHISNSLGTINPIKDIISIAHKNGIPVLIDGAQSAGHIPIDVMDLDCDFFTFSAHKVFGPTGIGALYAKYAHLEEMKPYQYGGEMIKAVTIDDLVLHDIPHRFEAGTPNIAGAVAMQTALEYLDNLSGERVHAHVQELTEYALRRLQEVPGLKIVGKSPKRGGIVSFVMENAHPHDISSLLDRDGIAIRAGHHCTQPTMDFFGIPGTARISMTCYNAREEIDYLVQCLQKIHKLFA